MEGRLLRKQLNSMRLILSGTAQVPTSGISREDGAVMVQEGKEGWAKDRELVLSARRNVPSALEVSQGGSKPDLGKKR